MKYFITIISLVISLGVSGQSHYFSFNINDKSEIKQITKIVSIDNVKKNTVWAYANDREFTEFQKLGYKITELPLRDTPKVLNMATTVSAMSNWDRYPTYEVYIEMMHKFATDYPNLCQVVNIGTSVDGRELIAVKLSDNVSTREAEPEFFYTGTMHGDETTGFVLLLRLADFLLSNYGTDTDATYILDNIELYINPAANPDGTYNGGNSTVSGSQRYNSNGEDLNRNFPDELSLNGPYEVETQAMMDFAEAHHFSMSANFHGGAEVMNYPWDIWYSDENPHADTDWFEKICTNYVSSARELYPNYMSDVTSDGVTEGADWYIAEGTRQDFMMYYQNCREVTVELSSTKLLSTDQLNNFWNYNKQALIDFLKEVTYGVNGRVTNTSGEPVDAKVEISGHDKDNSEVYTDPANGDYYRPIAPGTYTVTYSSEGYISQNHTITINNWKQTVVKDIVLEQAQQFEISGRVTNLEGTGLQNAKIQILNTSVEPVYTNVSGYYTFPNVFENTHTLVASLSGYAVSVKNVTLIGANQTVDFELAPSNAYSFEDMVPDEFSFGADAAWNRVQGVSYDGDYAMKSGNIRHNQESIMKVESNSTEAGVISFYKKVSSESTFDFLYFYIDTQLKGSWSGEDDWSFQSYQVTEGTHTYLWEYNKDGNAIGGYDCAWVDYIEIPKSTSDTEFVDSSKFVIGENPTKGKFEIFPLKTEILSVKIYDLSGKEMQYLSSNLTFYLSQPGVYIVKVTTPDGIVSKPLIVLK